jgi:hypothetical protein
MPVIAESSQRTLPHLETRLPTEKSREPKFAVFTDDGIRIAQACFLCFRRVASWAVPQQSASLQRVPVCILAGRHEGRAANLSSCLPAWITHIGGCGDIEAV